MIDNIENKYKLNPDRWNPKKTDKTAPENKKYILLFSFFIFGIIIVSTIKNETRQLQKEILNLKTTLNEVNITLHEANLEHQYLTSPENIDKLAKQNLDDNFTFYKKTQIKKLNEKIDNLISKDKKKIKKIKIKIAKKIQSKKEELKKLKEIYSKPDTASLALKKKLKREIESKKKEIKDLSSEPEKFFKNKKLQRWAGVQVIKAALGIPIIPGR